MKKIISVSRRTDVPAFYGEWFMKRISEGFVGYVNPFGGQKYLVSLKQSDVLCFVFWSKNYEPFYKDLLVLNDLGYQFYFNFTITGLPKIFECNLIETEIALETMKKLSRTFSPKHINWRYDPIIISDKSDYNFHLQKFENLASELSGYVERCYFSFVIQYGKVKRNFDKFINQTNIVIDNPKQEITIKLANDLSDIGHKYGINLLTCSGDYLLSNKVQKAHCIDGDIIEKLFLKNKQNFNEKPTRDQCGCTESIDIGTYDTCPHGCIYCYANINKDIANKRFSEHDINSAFLGFSKKESDLWLDELNKKIVKPKKDFPTLFD